MEEYLDLYNDNKEKIGVIPRSKKKELPEGQHILVSTLIVINNQNKIMLQLTSKSKGNVLALPGEHVLHNEDSEDAIVREMYEEQGIKIDKEEITFVEERLANRVAFFDIYYLKADYNKADMILQEEEVADVIWMSPEDIFKEYDNGNVRKSSLDSIKNFLNINTI